MYVSRFRAIRSSLMLHRPFFQPSHYQVHAMRPHSSIVSRCRLKSPWLFHLNSGSCNGCDIEILSVLSPRYDLERYGCQLVASPRHADVLLVTGAVTRQMLPRVIRVFEQIPEFKVVVAIGNCAINGCVFSQSEMIVGPVDKHIPVDTRVHGCPPRPEEIIKGVMAAMEAGLGNKSTNEK